MNTIYAQRYAGAYTDPVTAAAPLGNGYRFYLPGLMRFNAPDGASPFGAGGPNPYAYCEADPVNRVDPTGHFSFFDIFAYIGKALQTVFDYTSVAWLTVHKILPAVGAKVPNWLVKTENVTQTVIQDTTFTLLAVGLSVFTDGASLSLLSFVAASADIVSGDLAVVSDVTSAIPGRTMEDVTKSLSLGAMATGFTGGAAASGETFVRSATTVADAGELAERAGEAVRGGAREALGSVAQVPVSLFKRTVRLAGALTVQTFMNAPALLIPFSFGDSPRVERRVTYSGRLGVADAPAGTSNDRNQTQSRLLAQNSPLAK